MAQPKGLNELLKWGIENSTSSTTSPSTDTNTGTATTTATTTTNNNSDPSTTTSTTTKSSSHLTPELLAQLFGGPSEADLMRAAVAHIRSPDPDITLASRLTAFDNLEQLVESLDNANLLSRLGLWAPLLELLAHGEAQVRLMAAWCVGTAVQNNEPCQERLVALGGVERLVAMALGERVPAPAPATEEESPTSSNGDDDDARKKKTNGDGEGLEEGEKRKEENNEVRRKAVYALSSAIRNYQPAVDVCTSELRKKGELQVDEKIDATDMDAINSLIDGLKAKAVNA